MTKILTAVSTTAMLFALASNTLAQDTPENADGSVAEVVEEAVTEAADATQEAATDVVEETMEAANEAVTDVVEGAEAVVEEAVEATDEAVAEVAEEAEAATEDAVEVTEEVAEDAAEAVEETTETEAEEVAADATEAAAEVEAAPIVADLNQVVAKGEGFEIYLGDVLALKSELPSEYVSQDPATLFPELVTQLVSQAIISQEADTDSDVYKFKERQAERAIAVNQVLEDYIEESMTEEYLQSTYDEVIGDVPSEMEYNAAHILVETLEDAQAIIAEINDGADFTEVAKEKSTGPSGPQGGELDWFGPGQMVPEFETAAAALEVGAITAEPVQTQFGFHVIKLNDKREMAKPTREEVDQQLREYATQLLMEEKVGTARADVDVEIMEDINPAVLNAEF